MLFGNKETPPYVEEKLPGRYVVYDKEGDTVRARPTTEMEECLIELLVDAQKPMSKSEFRDACLRCGEEKQTKVDEATHKANIATADVQRLEVENARLKQLLESKGIKYESDDSSGASPFGEICG